MNDERHDVQNLNLRLSRIESHVVQIKWLLVLLILIAIVGLPGVLAALLSFGILGLFVALVGGAGLYAFIFLIDFLFFRSSRKRREADMEEEFNTIVREARANVQE